MSAQDRSAATVAFRMHLVCGHEIDYGPVPLSAVAKLTPRRKDGSFGAAKCPHGRRRVVYTQTTFGGRDV